MVLGLMSRTVHRLTSTRPPCGAGPDCGHRGERNLRPGEGRGRRLPVVSIPRPPVRDRNARPGAVRPAARAWPRPAGVGGGGDRGRVARRRLHAADARPRAHDPSSAGFVTGMYVVLTPLIAFACFGVRIGRVVWAGVALATVGLALLAGVHGGGLGGDALVLAGAAVYSLQIVLMERYAPLYDLLGFTLLEMLAAFVLARRRRGTDVRGAARLDGLGRAARHRDLRERARLPHPDVGAADARPRPGRRSSSRSSRCGRRSSATGSPATGWARYNRERASIEGLGASVQGHVQRVRIAAERHSDLIWAARPVDRQRVADHDRRRP